MPTKATMRCMANKNRNMMESYRSTNNDPIGTSIGRRISARGQKQSRHYQSWSSETFKCYNYNGLGAHSMRNCPMPKLLQDSDYFKDKMQLMQAQETDNVMHSDLMVNEVPSHRPCHRQISIGRSKLTIKPGPSYDFQILRLRIQQRSKKAETLSSKPISALTLYPPNMGLLSSLSPELLPTKSQIEEKDNVIRHLKDLVANVNDRSREPYNAIDVTALIEQNDCDRVELEKVKQHYKELYDSIKITRAHTSEKTSTMLNEIESLKAQLRSKEPCFITSETMSNQNHLKESVETVREIVEEARVVKPLDNSLHYACQYTKLSQELLECVIGTCPKSFNERDNKAPSTPVTRKKQYVIVDDYQDHMGKDLEVQRDETPEIFVHHFLSKYRVWANSSNRLSRELLHRTSLLKDILSHNNTEDEEKIEILQLLPIETWELSRISSLYVLLPPVYDYVFQQRSSVEEFSEQTFDEICPQKPNSIQHL
ncbi:hypothetical protein Tco_1418055 [Tanacetum coccineum]